VTTIQYRRLESGALDLQRGLEYNQWRLCKRAAKSRGNFHNIPKQGWRASKMVKTYDLLRAVMLLCLFVAPSSAQDPPSAESDGQIIERFLIQKGDDGLFVPVRVNGNTVDFLLDTGCTYTVFDRSLTSGASVGSQRARGAEDAVDVPFFSTPPSSVGHLDLPLFAPAIGAIDMRFGSEVLGRDVLGFLGMDFLRNFVVEINFDIGTVLFLKTVRDKHATQHELTSEAGMPCIGATFAGQAVPHVLIDTGSLGHGSGSIEADLVKELINAGRARRVGNSLTYTLSGPVVNDEIRANNLMVGGLTLRDPILTKSKGNRLSLNYLSRYLVTFDFPNKRLYLSKSARFEQSDKRDLSGLHLIRRQGCILVQAMDSDSAARSAGIEPSDTIRRFDAKEVATMKLSEIRKRLCDPGRVQIIVERSDTEHEIELSLESEEK
jgi:hypothetical protein